MCNCAIDLLCNFVQFKEHLDTNLAAKSNYLPRTWDHLQLFFSLSNKTYFHASPYIYFDIYVGLAFQTIFVPSLSLILHNFCVYIAFSKVILIHNSTQIQKIYHVRKYINKIKYQQNNADIFFIIKKHVLCFITPNYKIYLHIWILKVFWSLTLWYAKQRFQWFFLL